MEGGRGAIFLSVYSGGTRVVTRASPGLRVPPRAAAHVLCQFLHGGKQFTVGNEIKCVSTLLSSPGSRRDMLTMVSNLTLPRSVSPCSLWPPRQTDRTGPAHTWSWLVPPAREWQRSGRRQGRRRGCRRC